ncbi:MAG: ABC transporter substrate-binding protein [Chloroflexota bacterium]|nr:ABC transporter substrate-binding protein [Chloroflexota bacterium]
MDERTLAVFDAFQAGRLSRRQFVKRLTALGFASGTIGAFLAACGSSSTSPAASPANAVASPPAAAAPTTAAPIPTPAPAPTSAPAATTASGTSTSGTSTSTDLGILTSPDPNPKRGGTLTMAFGVTTSNYDMQQGAASSVLCHLYNNLIRLNLVDGLKTIVPDVAQRWDVSPDGLIYTFKLRSGVLFHDGTPLTSADVVATYNRMIFPPQGVVSLLKDRYSAVTKVEAVDPLTARFTLKQPSAIFLLILTDTTQAIYSKKTLDANNNDLRTVEVAPGTGPFMFKEYKASEKWTFVKNPNYWNKDLPYLDSLALIHVPALSDRGTAVLTGQADLSWNVSKETWDEGAKHPDTIKTNRVGNFGAYQVIINAKVKPFDDPRVRRAINLALNKQGLIQAFITQEQIDLSRWAPHGGEFATPREVIATLPGYRPDKTQDIADAKKLLADAGFPNGIQGVELLSASVPAHAEIMAPAIQDQLKQALNIDIKIRVSERSLLVEDEKAGRFTLVLDTPSGPIADFSPIGNTYFKTGGSQNFGGYSNPKFDDLLKQSDSEIDPTKRRDLLNQIQDLLDQDPPWLFIGYTDHLLIWHSYVKGLALDKRQISEWGRVDTAWLDK